MRDRYALVIHAVRSTSPSLWRQAHRVRQTSGSAHDSLCNEARSCCPNAAISTFIQLLTGDVHRGQCGGRYRAVYVQLLPLTHAPRPFLTDLVRLLLLFRCSAKYRRATSGLDGIVRFPYLSLPLVSCKMLFFCCRGFGHFMADSAMVIMWPSRDDVDADANGSNSSVTLSQRRAPYETMPTPDPDPPFVATLELAQTSVRPPPPPAPLKLFSF